MVEKIYRSIVDRLREAGRALYRRQALEGGLTVLAAACMMLVAMWLSVVVFWPGRAIRLVVVLLSLAALAYLFVGRFIKPLLASPPLLPIALRLERHYGKLQERLVASLQLYDKLAGSKEDYSPELIEKVIEEAGQEIRGLDFGVVVERRRKPILMAALGASLLALACLLAPGRMATALRLYGQPLAQIAPPNSLVLTVSPEQLQAVKNQDVTIDIAASGGKIRHLELAYRFADGGWSVAKTEELEHDTSAGEEHFRYTFKRIKRDVDYQARAGQVRSNIGRITVVDPPRLVDLALRLHYPTYTGMRDEELPPNEGNITAIKGTVVYLTGLANKALSEAALVFWSEATSDTMRRQLALDGRKITGQFEVSRSGQYFAALRDSNGLVDPQPIVYQIAVLEDQPPYVEIVFPAVDIDLDERMLVPLEAQLRDDFGFSRLDLVWWVMREGSTGEKSRKALPVRLGVATEMTIAYDWDVEPLRLLPGDLVYYQLEVLDNDAVSGPKSGVSKTYTARLPSLDEIVADITGANRDAMEQLASAVDAQKQVAEQLEELARDLAGSPEVDWQKREGIKQALGRQTEIVQKLEKLAEQLQQNYERYARHEMATREILDKMQEIQQLFEKVATPQLKETLRRLEEALKQMDRDKLMQAMKNLQLDVDQMKQDLDRLLALLKKFELEQQLDMMAKMAEKLAEKQQEINERLEQSETPQQIEQLQGPQASQERDFAALKDQFERTEQMNQQMNQIPEQQMAQAAEMMNSPELQKLMQEMMRQLKQANKAGGSRSGQQLKQQFDQLADLFKQMLSLFQSQQQQKVVRALMKLLQDVVFVSHMQEELADSSAPVGGRFDYAKEMAAQQKELEAAADRLATQLTELTKETLFISRATLEKLAAVLRSMQSAAEKLDRLQPRAATGDQVEAMSGLNQSAMMLKKSLDQAQACPSGSGMNQFMQQLADLGQMQQQLNQQTQGMLPLPVGQALSLLQQRQLEELAAQQEAIQQQLQQLYEEYGEQGNVLGRLDELAQQMQKVAEELRQHRADETTLMRQERILSRLLDAQKSINRRDFTERRRARTGEDVMRRSPAPLGDSKTVAEELAEAVKKALMEKYPRRYESAIKEYFRALVEDKAIER